MPVLLEVKHLVKKYGDLLAVNDVTFSIEQGECFGLLGPNGAGKTTTIEVVEDIIPPTSGSIKYKGRPRASSFREEVGIQFQQTSLLSFLTVFETLKTFKHLFPKSCDLTEIVDLCHLEEFQHQYNDKISGGQRQRFMLALALINNPDLVFLDEPSTGMDPQARRNLWDVIQKIKAEGKTIVLTTHYMEEAQVLCDKIIIMDYGKIIAWGSPYDLIGKYCSGVTVILPKRNFGHSLQEMRMVHQEVEDKIEIITRDLNACLEELLTRKVNLADMIVRSPNLEDVFLLLTGRQLRE